MIASSIRRRRFASTAKPSAARRPLPSAVPTVARTPASPVAIDRSGRGPLKTPKCCCARNACRHCSVWRYVVTSIESRPFFIVSRHRRALIRCHGPPGSDGSLSYVGSATRGDPEALRMLISSQLFENYLQCSTKCWLRSGAEPVTGNCYADWIRAQKEAYFQEGLKRLLPTLPESGRVTAPPIPKSPKDVSWRLAIDVRWRTGILESCLRAVERLPAESRSRHAQLIPYRFEFVNKITKEHKLLLAFDALLLSEVVGREVPLGKIVHGDHHATLKVNTLSLASEVRKRIKDIAGLLAGNSPPDLRLNRHCGQCEFQARCRAQ